ncbi:MAG: fibronectin type III domain-containing protein [Actinobacteria bacterium]|nr:fibronectin type III domain-containing protein [Actinomycetota bacterium]
MLDATPDPRGSPVSVGRGAGRAARLVAVLFICALNVALLVPTATAAPVTYFRTGASAGVASYSRLDTAPATSSFVTSIDHGSATGSFLFQPGRSGTATTGFPGPSGTGFGYATTGNLNGTVPAGTWSVNATVTTDVPATDATGNILVAYYAVRSDGSSRRIHVQQGTSNVLSGPGTRTTTVSTALPAIAFSNERLAVELYLVISRNEASGSTVWRTSLRHGDAGDTVIVPGPPTAPDLAPPGTLQVTSVGDNRIGLAWGASSDSRVAGYVVQRATSSAGPWTDVTGVIGGTSHTDTGLNNGTRYYHRVVAVDAAGTRSPPSNSTSSVPADVDAPGAPGSISVSPAGSFRLQVSWAPSSAGDIAGYEIQRAGSAAGPFSRIAGPVGGTSFTNDGLPSGSTWYYRVIAIDDDGLRSAPTAPAAGTVAPSPPSGLRVVAVADRSVALAWNGTAEAVTRYVVERSTSSGGPFAVVGATGGLSFTDGGLVNGTTYYYRVRAEDAAGASSSPSATVSAVPKDTGIPAPPTTLVAVPQAGSKVRLDWGPSPSASTVGYRVYRSTGGSFTDISGRIGGRSFIDGPLPVGVPHRYHVRAEDASGTQSIPSTEAAYTVPPSAPGNLRVTAVSESTASLEWNASNDPRAGYRVLRSTSPGGPYSPVSGKVSGTTFTDAGLVLGTSYFYVVQAESVDGTRSAPSNEVRVVPVNGPPTPPSGLRVSDTTSGGELRVTWAANPEPDIARYVVQRATSASGPWGEISTTTSTTILDGGLLDGTRYHYRVIAVDTVGLRSSPSAVASGVPSDTTPPSAPSRPVVSQSGLDLRVQWAASEGAVRYRVLRTTNSGGPYAVLGEVSGARTFTDTGVARGVAYYYTVVAIDASGNESPPSAESLAAVVPLGLPSPPPSGGTGGGTTGGTGGGTGGTGGPFGDGGPVAGGPTTPPSPSTGLPPGALGGGDTPGAATGDQDGDGDGDGDGDDEGRTPIAAGQIPGDALGDSGLPPLSAADEALRSGRFSDALSGTAAEVAEDIGTVARTFRIPLIVLAVLLIYLIVQGRLDRTTLPMTVETPTGTADDDDEYIL